MEFKDTSTWVPPETESVMKFVCRRFTGGVLLRSTPMEGKERRVRVRVRREEEIEL